MERKTVGIVIPRIGPRKCIYSAGNKPSQTGSYAWFESTRTIYFSNYQPDFI